MISTRHGGVLARSMDRPWQCSCTASRCDWHVTDGLRALCAFAELSRVAPAPGPRAWLQADRDSEREVSRQEGAAFAKSKGCLFVETSAKANTAVTQARAPPDLAAALVLL
jgi:Ras family